MKSRRKNSDAHTLLRQKKNEEKKKRVHGSLSYAEVLTDDTHDTVEK